MKCVKLFIRSEKPETIYLIYSFWKLGSNRREIGKLPKYKDSESERKGPRQQDKTLAKKCCFLERELLSFLLVLIKGGRKPKPETTLLLSILGRVIVLLL